MRVHGRSSLQWSLNLGYGLLVERSSSIHQLPNMGNEVERQAYSS
jgi:hypothetical protein